MILYHASTVKIDKFYIPYGGLHVGGVHSALEAALRKIRSYDGPFTQHVYIHRLEVDIGRSILYDDMGDDEGWRTLIARHKDECDTVEYRNSFEPDVVNSFLIWDATRVTILDIDVMSQDEAEDKLNEFYEENHIL